jgi:hypothetical protein
VIGESANSIAVYSHNEGSFIDVNVSKLNLVEPMPVPYGNSFILVGGYDEDTFYETEKLYLFDEENYTWKEMEQESCWSCDWYICCN